MDDYHPVLRLRLIAVADDDDDFGISGGDIEWIGRKGVSCQTGWWRQFRLTQWLCRGRTKRIVRPTCQQVRLRDWLRRLRWRSGLIQGCQATVIEQSMNGM